ncbi:winged helix-turn-helix domain-containing protein [Streptomyces qinglanensis]|uniref:winged helix-turn-helix domain-containing protein n=1 Tax=Streptomyces qinglanensis TaxID=943816 RepID=UPI003D73B9DF
MTPKYREIETTIRARIADGTYPPGTALPSDDALADELGVTRPTVRAGLAELRATDAVTVIAGRGAFVRDPELTALRRERDVAWDMAKREAEQAEQAEATGRRALDLAAELEAEGHPEVAERIRNTLEPQAQ